MFESGLRGNGVAYDSSRDAFTCVSDVSTEGCRSEEESSDTVTEDDGQELSDVEDGVTKDVVDV